MILKAQHHPVIHLFFKGYTLWKVSRCFKKIYISGNFYDRKLPILLVANHVSWWDGFWVSYLNLKVFKRKYHFMMLESQLRTFSFLNKTGGYSIKKGSRSVLESLHYTAELLTDPRNTVLLFPQGEIQSIYNPVFQFEKGIERLLKMVGDKIQILFIANLIDYYSHPVPDLSIFYEEYTSGNFDVIALQKEYNRFYSFCLTQQQQKTDP